MSPLARKKYLLLDKRCRRYSAPEDFRAGFAQSYITEESEDDSRKSRVSAIDLSVLFEEHSGSDSSLELDTSKSRDSLLLSSRDQHVSKPAGCYECHGKPENKQIEWATAFHSKFIWKTVIISQIMALCASVINWTMDVMTHQFSVNAQSLPHYLLLTGVWSTQLAVREGARGIIQVIRLTGLRYLFLALLHVEASTLTYLALRHPTFFGNQMMDCVASCLSLIIAYVCLDVQFQQSHIVGFSVAFMGAIGISAAIFYPTDVDPVDAFWGDFLRFGCGIIICINTLAEELIVKAIDTVEYLGMIGLFGSFICAGQTLAMDRDKAIVIDGQYWCALCMLSFSELLFISLGPRVLKDVGTTGLHLSLITYPFYYQLIQYCFTQTAQQFGILMFISYLLIIGGSYIFTLKRTSIERHYFFPVRVTLTGSESYISNQNQ